MKQNSSILFHPTLNSLRIRYLGIVLLAAIVSLTGCRQNLCAAEQPEYLASFDPAKGFKPVQRDLTAVFLQLAGSLQAYGSPEPYLRHVAAEHIRIENLYRQKFGREPKSYRPAYLTDAYIDKLAANWKLLAPKLGLDAWAKEFGRFTRDAIKGTRGNGTIIIEIFNQHQARVFDEMAGKAEQHADFERLKAHLINRLELNNPTVDTTGFEIARRDSVTFAVGIHGVTMKLFKRLDEGLKPEASNAVKSVITSIIMDTGMAAHSELQAGISEWALQNAGKPPIAYDISQETRLNEGEKAAMRALLKKERFAKSDFPKLDSFYEAAYERLSEAGKDELSKRVWNGTRP